MAAVTLITFMITFKEQIELRIINLVFFNIMCCLNIGHKDFHIGDFEYWIYFLNNKKYIYNVAFLGGFKTESG